MTGFETNPTQLCGLLACGLAAGACARAAAARRGAVWAWLALAQLLAFTEVVWSGRHRVHGWVDALLTRQGWYGERAGLQIALVVLLAVATGAALAWLGRHTAAAARHAAFATLALFAFFALEAISLHSIDAAMYRSLGGVLLIGWAWAVAAGMVIVAASLDARR